MALKLYVLGGVLVIFSPIIVLTARLFIASKKTKAASKAKEALFEQKMLAKHMSFQDKKMDDTN